MFAQTHEDRDILLNESITAKMEGARLCKARRKTVKWYSLKGYVFLKAYLKLMVTKLKDPISQVFMDGKCGFTYVGAVGS